MNNKKPFVVFLILLAFCFASFADDTLLLADVPIVYGEEGFIQRIEEKTGGEREPVGVVLSGGSARAFAHIGVLQYLEEQGMYPDYIVSNSMGSIIALLYGAGMSPAQILDLVTSSDFGELFDFSIPINSGLLNVSKFKSLIGAYVGEDLRLEDLMIPVMVVCEDMVTKRQILITEGNFLDVLAASFALPVYFGSVEYEGHILIDGGIANLVPVDVAYRYSDNVLVSTTFYAGKDLNLRNPLTGLNVSIDIGKRRQGVVELKEHPNAVWVRCNVEDFSFMDFKEGSSLAQNGYASCLEKADEISRLVDIYNGKVEVEDGPEVVEEPAVESGSTYFAEAASESNAEPDGSATTEDSQEPDAAVEQGEAISEVVSEPRVESKVDDAVPEADAMPGSVLEPEPEPNVEPDEGTALDANAEGESEMVPAPEMNPQVEVEAKPEADAVADEGEDIGLGTKASSSELIDVVERPAVSNATSMAAAEFSKELVKKRVSFASRMPKTKRRYDLYGRTKTVGTSTNLGLAFESFEGDVYSLRDDSLLGVDWTFSAGDFDLKVTLGAAFSATSYGYGTYKDGISVYPHVLPSIDVCMDYYLLSHVKASVRGAVSFTGHSSGNGIAFYFNVLESIQYRSGVFSIGKLPGKFSMLATQTLEILCPGDGTFNGYFDGSSPLIGGELAFLYSSQSFSSRLGVGVQNIGWIGRSDSRLFGNASLALDVKPGDRTCLGIDVASRFSFDGKGNVPVFSKDGFMLASTTIKSQGSPNAVAENPQQYMIAASVSFDYVFQAKRLGIAELVLVSNSTIGAFCNLLWYNGAMPAIQIGAKLSTDIGFLGLKDSPLSIGAAYDFSIGKVLWKVSFTGAL